MLAVKDEKEEVEKTIMSLKEVEQAHSIVDESLFEIKLDILEQYHEEEIPSKIIEDKVKRDYQEEQIKIILSNKERKAMWDEYKLYVDKFILIGLQDATLCRYNHDKYNKL